MRHTPIFDVTKRSRSGKKIAERSIVVQDGERVCFTNRDGGVSRDWWNRRVRASDVDVQ